MKFIRSWPLVEVAILLFAAWQARDLINAWQHSPHDRFGWVALLVWLTPPGLRIINPQADKGANFYLLGAAIGCGLLGELTEVHFLKHVALGLAAGARISFSPRTWPWRLAAVAWMPIFGWWLADFSAGTVFILRLALALASCLSIWLIKKQGPP